MKAFVMAIALFFTLNTIKAQEQISSKYYSGEYLVYDCENGRNICTDQGSYERCESEYRGFKAQGKKVWPCYPIKKFISFGACKRAQQKLIHKGFKGVCRVN